MKPHTIKIVLTITITFSQDTRHINVNNTFLNGKLKEAVYMDKPHGFKDTSRPNLICKLIKILYGLKQEPSVWLQKLFLGLVELGFIGSKSNTSMFISLIATKTTILLIYVDVDDIVVTSSDFAYLNVFIGLLNSKFALNALRNLSYLLGIK